MARRRPPADPRNDVPGARATRPPPPQDGRCALCEQPVPLSFHHLVPRRVHAQRWARARDDAHMLNVLGIWICRPCHDFLHAQFSERELGERLDSLDRLREEPRIARHLAWASRQRRQR